MTRRNKLTLFAAAALALTGTLAIWTHTTEAGSTGPDVTVYELQNTANHGAVGGVRAYSVGTTSCNIGDEPLWWCDDDRSYCDDEQHPVIAQNLYRLKDGRFEQLGMSWLKHGFLSLNLSASQCGDGSCDSPPHGGDQLGVGCTDPYGAGLNGSRPLGMRSEVNATTGTFPFPATFVSWTQQIDQRIQAAEAELDPALNPDARYWIEAQYVAADDASRGNGLNNASHREVSVTPGSFNLGFAGPTVRQQPAIFAWRAAQEGVEILSVNVIDSVPLQRFHAARRVTPAPGGGWHYEYAIHNLNSDRSGRAFTVRFPGGATIDNVGFRDVDHHSGEPYDTMDWQVVTGADSVTWFTDLFADDELANALRWGTMFSFWFDADRPAADLKQTLELFKDGVPTTLHFTYGSVGPPGLSDIFSDGFESGDTSAWTLSQP